MPTSAQGQEFDATEVFRLCTSRVRNADLRARFAQIEGDITTAATDYDIFAAEWNLHQVARANDVAGVITKDEMIKVYTGRMVPTTQPGRTVYDRIIGAPPDARCPLCGVGVVATLDHHLPKGEYPVFSVFPNNLVPCCSWCQDAKGEAFPDRAENQTLHPYYDNVEVAVWLRAEVVVGIPASFMFRVEPPQSWSTLIRRRLERHIEVFDLQRLFVSNAASHLSEIRHSLNYLHQAGGAVAVREHLQREASSREAVHRNSWAAAMYRAAGENQWFCDGGFAQT